MELWLTLLALYAWACTVRLPDGSAVFGARGHRGGGIRLRGLHWLAPWPSAIGITALRMPLHVSNDGHSLIAHADLSRGATPAATPDRTLDCEAQAGRNTADLFEERGAHLDARGRRFVACPTRAHTRVWHFVARTLVAAAPDARHAVWQQHVARSLDAARLARRLHEAQARTRWLGWACNALFLLVFAGVPLLGLARGAEAALAIAWPPLLGLTGLALVLAARAHRRLFPERRGERFTQLLTAALYPPALLRLPAEMIDAFTAGTHPLAWSLLLDQPDRARAAWTREIAWLDRRARLEPVHAEWLREMQRLIRDARPASLEVPMSRIASDPEAASYCPVCLEDFRQGFAHCAACDTSTTLYTRASQT